jgi:hypothetical protein
LESPRLRHRSDEYCFLTRGERNQQRPNCSIVRANRRAAELVGRLHLGLELKEVGGAGAQVPS